MEEPSNELRNKMEAGPLKKCMLGDERRIKTIYIYTGALADRILSCRS